MQEMYKESEQQSSWFLLLCKQKIIYLEKNIYDEWDYEDILFKFSESYEKEFKCSKFNYNLIVKQTPDTLLAEPQGVFLLDVDKEEATALQEKYGIICQSTQDLTDCPLITEECKFSLSRDDEQNEHSWKTLFESVIKVPSNALIIVDRYIFGWESHSMSNYGDGVENIKQILKSVLPATLTCDYHVLILFDESSSRDRNFTMQKVANQLEAFKNNVLKRPYNVVIELYSITNKCANYGETHNRRIISNYFLAYADHLIKAFKQDGTVICDQDIRIESAYSHGLKNNSDPSIKTINKLLEKLQVMHKQGIKEYDNATADASEYKVICATNADSTIRDIKNRLLLQN